MRDKKFILGFCISTSLYTAQAQLVTRLDNSTISHTDLDQKIQRLVAAANVHGLAINQL